MLMRMWVVDAEWGCGGRQFRRRCLLGLLIEWLRRAGPVRAHARAVVMPTGGGLRLAEPKRCPVRGGCLERRRAKVSWATWAPAGRSCAPRRDRVIVHIFTLQTWPFRLQCDDGAGAGRAGHSAQTKRKFIKSMRALAERLRFGALLLVSACGVFGGSLQAATVIKADNAVNLNIGASWVGGNVPGIIDIARWDSTVTGANTVSLGAVNLNLGTIQITNPGGPVTINGGGILTFSALGVLGTGIDMATATADLTINANIDIEDTPPTHIWNVGAGRTLTVAGNVGENGPANKTLTINGAGTTHVTGIIGTGENDLAVAKNGSGTLILEAANAYGGGTTVNRGVLNIRKSAALGTAAGNTIVNAGGELQLQGNISIAGNEDLCRSREPVPAIPAAPLCGTSATATN